MVVLQSGKTGPGFFVLGVAQSYFYQYHNELQILSATYLVFHLINIPLIKTAPSSLNMSDWCH